MTALDIRINQMINSLEREDRVPVITALKHCDGSFLSFQEELASQVWDYPELNVQLVLDKIAFDL